jgi:hypothetical protein
MNRLKILLLLVILAVLGVLFLQNQQPLVLKLLCPDRNTSCLYQTPQLPLAIWMGIFICGGVVTNLIWQVLHRFSYSSSKKIRYASDALYDNEVKSGEGIARDNTQYTDSRLNQTEVSEPLASNWGKSSYSEDWRQQSTKSSRDSLNSTPSSTSSEYEIRREPENVTLSGTTYSYKFKEAENKKSSPSNTPNLNKESNSTEDDDEDWI